METSNEDPAAVPGPHRAAVFLPDAVPRLGRVAFWSPRGAAGGPAGSRITVVRPQGAGVRRRSVPAQVLPVGAALPVLLRAGQAAHAHPATAAWGAAARHALRLVARGRLLPGLTAGDVDAWRAGPLDAADTAQLRAVAAALPGEAYAVPLPGRGPLRLPEPEWLVRRFLDAVADTLPRSPAAAFAYGPPFAAQEPQRLPGARAWADEAAAGEDAGVTLSLRLELAAHRVFDGPPGAAAGPAREPAGHADPAPASGNGGGPPEPGGEPPEDDEPVGTVVVQVHAAADPALLTDAARLWEDGGDAAFGSRARVGAVLALRRAARVWEPLARLLDRAVPDSLRLTAAELDGLLGEGARRLADAGVPVHWPQELSRTLTATAVVRAAPGSATDGSAFFDAESSARFDWRLALGGEDLTEDEMDALAEAHRPLVRLRDGFVLVDPALVRRARKRHLGLLGPADALAAVLTGTAEADGETVPVVPVGRLAELRDRLAAPPGHVAPPPGLAAVLRGYQLRGLAWLARMTSLGLGGCLADDMGLGKTVTLIALHLHRARREPTLVVCPASLLGNWQREIERFAPGVPVRRLHGAARSLDGVEAGDGGEGGDGEGGGGFVLTTYGTLRARAEQLAAYRWGLLVADEAQHAKNPRSATARALRSLSAPARVALTGTPVENNLSELWAVLDWTTPGLLGPLPAFRARHARAVEGGEDPEAAERLARLVRPFLLRRRKSDPGVAPELPPKTETNHAVPLTREQAALYRAVVRERMAAVGDASGMRRRGLVMRLLTTLKQICNHPAQYLREEPASAGRLAGRSGKLALLDELLDTVLAEDGSVLVFTQYVAMARLLQRHLGARGVPVQVLDGGTPVRRRAELVDRFQSGEVPVFLLSLRAAGTGLNLTRAGHVVHYDRWWNPAVEEQATDRAHRIGQTRPVQVHRLIAQGTVEERIAELLEGKRRLADAVLGSGEGEAALSELTDRELADLVALRRAEP